MQHYLCACGVLKNKYTTHTQLKAKKEAYLLQKNLNPTLNFAQDITASYLPIGKSSISPSPPIKIEIMLQGTHDVGNEVFSEARIHKKMQKLEFPFYNPPNLVSRN